MRLLAGLLAPYLSLLQFTTRRLEMQRLVSEIITPIAAQLAQQKHSQLARLGCTVEEAPCPPPGKGGGNQLHKGVEVISGRAGKEGWSSGGTKGGKEGLGQQQQQQGIGQKGVGGREKTFHLVGSGEGPMSMNDVLTKILNTSSSSSSGGGGGVDAGTSAIAGVAGVQGNGAISHKRFESGEPQ